MILTHGANSLPRGYRKQIHQEEILGKTYDVLKCGDLYVMCSELAYESLGILNNDFRYYLKDEAYQIDALLTNGWRIFNDNDFENFKAWINGVRTKYFPNNNTSELVKNQENWRTKNGLNLTGLNIPATGIVGVSGVEDLSLSWNIWKMPQEGSSPLEIALYDGTSSFYIYTFYGASFSYFRMPIRLCRDA